MMKSVSSEHSLHTLCKTSLHTVLHTHKTPLAVLLQGSLAHEAALAIGGLS
jgi:hypothetical protein